MMRVSQASLLEILQNAVRFVRTRRLAHFGIKDSHIGKPDDVIPQFGFFGELGYAILSYLPFLNHLAQSGIEVRTISFPGIRSLFYFSRVHTEVSGDSQDGWCSQGALLKFGQQLSSVSPLTFVPTSEGVKKLIVADITGQFEWVYKEVHQLRNSSGAFQPLKIPPTDNDVIRELVEGLGSYWVVNVKGHNQWAPAHQTGGTGQVLNTFSYEEITEISEIARDLGVKVVVNYSPAGTSPSEEALKLPKSREIEVENVVNAKVLYDVFEDSNLKMDVQIHLLRNASHVFASQGGNSYLAGLVVENLTVLMRGGWDYANLLNMKIDYNLNLDVIYELSQSKILRESLDHIHSNGRAKDKDHFDDR